MDPLGIEGCLIRIGPDQVLHGPGTLGVAALRDVQLHEVLEGQPEGGVELHRGLESRERPFTVAAR